MKLLIIGCERSGTTAIAQLISKGSKLSLLNDPPESWYIYPLINIVGIRGFSMNLIFKIWKYKIVKVPGFATILPELRKVHPKPFKIIYMVRDPRDNFSAIKERLVQDMNGLYLNVHFLNIKGKNVCENIAYRWNKYLDLSQEYAVKHKNEILFVRYEDFLKDKETVLKQIAKFGLIKLNTDLISNDLDKQINKGWSNVISGSERYKKDLTFDEIQTIERITKNNMKKYNYK